MLKFVIFFLLSATKGLKIPTKTMSSQAFTHLHNISWFYHLLITPTCIIGTEFKEIKKQTIKDHKSPPHNSLSSCTEPPGPHPQHPSQV
jgi:hypothetical protein